MRRRLRLACHLGCLLLFLPACASTSRVATRAYNLIPFTEDKPLPAQAPREAPSRRTDQLAFKMELTPKKVKLGDTRRIDVKIALENTGKRFTQLSFPTTQRIEILVRDDKNHLVTQWSEDRSYDQVPGYVSINPGERVEYSTTLSTRDLQAGKSYTILAFLPNYDHLRSETVVKPEP